MPTSGDQTDKRNLEIARLKFKSYTAPEADCTTT